MKKLTFLSLALVAGISLAHDEGHGPKVTDTPKQGGKVASVVSTNEASKGLKGQLSFKAELVRGENDLVKVYLYDREMNALPEAQLSQFGKAATATVEHLKKGKIAKTSKFSLDLRNGVFEGKLGEKPKTQTFNLHVKMTEGEKEFLAAFDGLETKTQ